MFKYEVASDETPAADAHLIFTATRTGKRVHIASPGSSVTLCGHWLKFDSAANRMRRVDPAHVCERCEEIREVNAKHAAARAA